MNSAPRVNAVIISLQLDEIYLQVKSKIDQQTDQGKIHKNFQGLKKKLCAEARIYPFFNDARSIFDSFKWQSYKVLGIKYS